MKKPPPRYFRVENFKAIRDSGRVEFGWLTALTGNNGSGKSRLVEAIETLNHGLHGWARICHEGTVFIRSNHG